MATKSVSTSAPRHPSRKTGEPGTPSRSRPDSDAMGNLQSKASVGRSEAGPVANTTNGISKIYTTRVPGDNLGTVRRHEQVHREQMARGARTGVSHSRQALEAEAERGGSALSASPAMTLNYGPTDDGSVRGLPSPGELERRETFGAAERGTRSLRDGAISVSEETDGENSVRTVHMDFMIGDDNGGIRTITLFTIVETPLVENSTSGPAASPEALAMPATNARSYPIGVSYERVILYFDIEGREITARVSGQLAFTRDAWRTLSEGEPENIPDMMHREAAAASFQVQIAGKNQATEDVEIAYLTEKSSIDSQLEATTSTFGETLLQNPSWFANANAEHLGAFLDPRTTSADQYASLRQFLEAIEDAERAEIQGRLTPQLNDDIATVKDILLDEWIDADQEDELMALVRKWSRHRDVLAPSGSTYFDEFLNELRSSSWHRDYGLFDGESTSFYDSLTEEVEEQAGDLNTLIAQNSIEHGTYSPQWHSRGEARAINVELVNRSATQILDGLEGYTSDNDIRIISSTITGLPASEQAAVLGEIMSRYDETEFGIFARYGEAAPEKMLYYLFEDLDDERRQSVGDALVNNGVMDRQSVDGLIAGRGWLGEYLPASHHYITEAAEDAAEYYAGNIIELEGTDRHFELGLNYLGGGLASLADRQNLQTTVTVLATARYAPAVGSRIAAIHPLAESGLLVAGTGMAAYGVGTHGRELVTGETAEGVALSREERIASGLLTMSNALFLAAPMMNDYNIQIGRGGLNVTPRPSMAMQAQNRYAENMFNRAGGDVAVGPMETAPFSRNWREAFTPRLRTQASQMRMDESGDVFIVRNYPGGSLSGDMIMTPVGPRSGTPGLPATGATGFGGVGGSGSELIVAPSTNLMAPGVGSPSTLQGGGSLALPGQGSGLPLVLTAGESLVPSIHYGSRIVLPSDSPLPGEAPIYSMPLGPLGGGGVRLMNRGLRPSDFPNSGLRGPLVADDATHLELWFEAERALATSPRDNIYKQWLAAVEDGSVHTWSSKELGKVYSSLWRRYSLAAREAGFDVATLHHWNYNKGDFPLQVVDPRNLMPFYGKDLMAGGTHPGHQGGIHPLTSSGHPTNDPIAPIHVQPLENYNVPYNPDYPGMPEWWHPPMAEPPAVLPFGWNPYYPPRGNWPPEFMDRYPWLRPE